MDRICALVFLQASYSVKSDEQFAVELQQQELALLDDSRVARTLQQVILKYMLVIQLYCPIIRTHTEFIIHLCWITEWLNKF